MPRRSWRLGSDGQGAPLAGGCCFQLESVHFNEPVLLTLPDSSCCGDPIHKIIFITVVLLLL